MSQIVQITIPFMFKLYAPIPNVEWHNMAYLASSENNAAKRKSAAAFYLLLEIPEAPLLLL